MEAAHLARSKRVKRGETDQHIKAGHMGKPGQWLSKTGKKSGTVGLQGGVLRDRLTERAGSPIDKKAGGRRVRS